MNTLGFAMHAHAGLIIRERTNLASSTSVVAVETRRRVELDRNLEWDRNEKVLRVSRSSRISCRSKRNGHSPAQTRGANQSKIVRSAAC